MRTRTIRQTVLIKASPAKVFDAFMDQQKHREFTGFKAVIENKAGGKFITCGHRNFGYTLLLQRGKRIIQAWSHTGFPGDHYSTIDIELEKTKEGYTRLIFNQYAAPAEAVEWLVPGWRSTYWKPLKDYLEKGIVQKLRK